MTEFDSRQYADELAEAGRLLDAALTGGTYTDGYERTLTQAMLAGTPREHYGDLLGNLIRDYVHIELEHHLDECADGTYAMLHAISVLMIDESLAQGDLDGKLENWVMDRIVSEADSLRFVRNFTGTASTPAEIVAANWTGNGDC
jgi:hypothetical protein